VFSITAGRVSYVPGGAKDGLADGRRCCFFCLKVEGIFGGFASRDASRVGRNSRAILIHNSQSSICPPT